MLSYPNSVRPSVCLSVTRRYCIKTAERIVMIFSPHDSPFILVFTADARSVGNSQLSCNFCRPIPPTVCYEGGAIKARRSPTSIVSKQATPLLTMTCDYITCKPNNKMKTINASQYQWVFIACSSTDTGLIMIPWKLKTTPLISIHPVPSSLSRPVP